MGGEVARCRLVGWNALVEVRVVLPFALPGLTTANGRAMAGPSAAGQARVGERSMGTGGRAASARAVGAADVRRSQGDSPLRWRARRCSSTNRRWGLARRAGGRPTGTGSRWPRPVQESRSVAPQTAVGPERRLTPTPEPAAPRRAAAVPPAPPTGRAGGGLPQPHTVAERVQHHIQHPHGARLVQRGVAVAALGRLHARRAARCGTRSRRSPPGWRRASAAAPRDPARRTRRRRGARRGRTPSGGRCTGCSAVDMPPMSQRSQIANSGRIPMAACSAACSAPGTRAMSTPTASRAASSRSYQTPRVCRVCRGQVERHGLQHRAVRCAPLVLHHLRGHRHLAERHPHRAALPAGEHCGHFDVGRRAGVGAPVRGRRRAPARPRRRDRGPARGSSRRGAGTPRRRARWRVPSQRRPCRASAPVSASTTATCPSPDPRMSTVPAGRSRSRARTTRQGGAAAPRRPPARRAPARRRSRRTPRRGRPRSAAARPRRTPAADPARRGCRG